MCGNKIYSTLISLIVGYLKSLGQQTWYACDSNKSFCRKQGNMFYQMTSNVQVLIVSKHNDLTFRTILVCSARAWVVVCRQIKSIQSVRWHLKRHTIWSLNMWNFPMIKMNVLYLKFILMLNTYFKGICILWKKNKTNKQKEKQST